MTKPRKTETIRTRCTEAWKYDLEMFAQARGVDTSDLVRVACDLYMGKPTLAIAALKPTDHARS